MERVWSRAFQGQTMSKPDDVVVSPCRRVSPPPPAAAAAADEEADDDELILYLLVSERFLLPSLGRRLASTRGHFLATPPDVN